jgi:uncharacterized protein
MSALAAFFCGLVFGLGLVVSGLAQPAKVLNFLDLFGRWDPSLVVVMAAALAVSGLGYALARQRPQPLLTPHSALPTRTDIDRPLLIGSGLFGIGWGLVGLCPGPALVNLATLSPPLIVFVLAMVAGMMVHDLWQRAGTAPSRQASGLATSADG